MKVYIILYSSLCTEDEDNIIEIDDVYSSYDEARKRLHELVEDEMDRLELSTDAGNIEILEDGEYNKQWGYCYCEGDQWIYHSYDLHGFPCDEISYSIVEREIL